MYKPKFTVTSQILTSISEIAEIKSIVERSRVLPLNEAQLRREAISRMAHTSTSIEGNKLAQYQVDKVLSGMSVNADEKSILEVKNYQAALVQMDKIAKVSQVLNIGQVLEIHKFLMNGLVAEEKRGHFRKGAIYVVDDLGDGREQLRYEGPPATKVPHLINELLKWLVLAKKEDLHPVLISSIFHVQFVTIHPFTDGNGRIARLLTALILYQSGWDFRKIIVLEDFYNQDRQAYYNALNIVQGNKYHEGEDLTPWVEYFIEGFLVEARQVNEKIALMGFGKVSEAAEQIFLDRDEIQIMDFLATTGRITSQDVREILGVAKRTAQLKLKNLTDKGLLKSQGSGPSTYHVLYGGERA
ncbi:hypothetical protein A3A14_02805 [Candidatus Daviesbacteria bacterium RIFCSPLOWO2_01_FULL_43_38]|uniref:Fido domain-containing protein n=2 Tax=Candidatus Daviesiibacteriota TaxID=1752718 RepID=A0A1F5K4L0_9BACT|nr:MAG: hypothetical protein UV41_C0006G0004 [Candidatus Daviesbacteria bacterium GW2011_GWA2_42_7]OGE19994.1 MAG: hypothetical protein A2874_00725 [Candidatus Daviesbacteria bacterium RIFCSPHIGHO2_01_FULL_43_17]OGE35744.1 MAG: hypothetical protein A3E45_00410 [Candidatus Daviesbacteria bacterium RIFCSPHIGHO2_12_FULL_43_11]OGE63432.1 MAG: hypothetical protein A3A14_02805 [Candidatus Daviesbacteria bacterium RIFCSPLOWO2_01_FULL_43_38]OGE69658.1 MAG: hypothetical protein A3J21_03110 [Candidatus D